MKPVRSSTTLALAVILVASAARRSAAQSTTISSEADLTTGFSTAESVRAAAGQLRVFGETRSRIRFNAEATWANRSDEDSDAFGAAYPYGGRLQLSEAYGERTFTQGAARTTVRVGQYRSPFGMSNRSDYAYSGLLRAPLLRYDGYWAVTNNFLERGVDVVSGTARLSVEGSLGTPGDIGTAKRRSGVSGLVRAQTTLGDLILGVSHMSSQGYMPVGLDARRLAFSGVDGRWMHGGVQLRGEWLVGSPDGESQTRAWFVDGSLHRPFMGPVTAVFRTERLTFAAAAPFIWKGEECDDEWIGVRQTAGVRVRLPRGFTAQVGLVLSGHELAEYGDPTAMDFALTYSIRRH
jgi:hypothetical protein